MFPQLTVYAWSVEAANAPDITGYNFIFKQRMRRTGFWVEHLTEMTNKTSVVK